MGQGRDREAPGVAGSVGSLSPPCTHALCTILLTDDRGACKPSLERVPHAPLPHVGCREAHAEAGGAW